MERYSMFKWKDGSILSGSQLFPTCSIYSMQSEPKSQVVLWIWPNSKVYMERQKIQNSQHSIEAEEQS